MEKMKFKFLICLLALCSALSNAQTLTLDNSYGNAGRFLTQFPGSNSSYVRSHGKFSDNRTLIGGYTRQGIPNCFVARLTDDGRIDSTFNSVGYNILNFGGSSSCEGVLIDSLGDIIITGFFTLQSGTSSHRNIFIAKFKQNGELDSNFCNHGILKLVTSNDEAAQTIRKFNNGFLVGGFSNDKACIRGYKFDGSIDSTFGNNGEYINAFNSTWSKINVLKNTGDNGVLAGGFVYNQTTGLDCMITKFSKKGIVDSLNFASNGTLIVNVDVVDEVYDIVLSNNQEFFVAGKTCCFKINSNGSMDPNFGVNGIVNYPTLGILLRDNGRILITTTEDNLVQADFNLIQLMQNGKIDSTFGNYGRLLIDFESFDDLGKYLFEVGNRILVAGYATTHALGTSPAIIALIPGSQVGTHIPPFEFKKILLSPNPVETITSLTFSSQESSPLTLQLFDLNGNLITTFLNQALLPSGQQTLELELPSGLSPGQYFLNLKTDQGQKTLKIIKQ